jgi:hypothetical protein
MKKYKKINEAETAEAQPETKAEGGKAPVEGEKPKEGKGLVDITKGPEEVLKALVPDFAPAGPGEEKTYTVPEDVRKKLLAGKEDGQEGDEKISLVAGSKKAGELIPTQANIDIDKSLADQIYHLYGNLEVALDGAVPMNSEAPEKGMVKSKAGQFPILTFGGNYIIDGHHRWSQICMTNPECMLKTADIKVDGVTDPKAIQALCHVILLAVYGKTVVKNVEGKNLLEQTPDAIKAAVLKGEGMKSKKPISEESLKLLAEAHKKTGGKVGIEEATAEKAAEMYAKNLETLKKLGAKAPVKIPRAFMPQPADSGDPAQFTIGGTVNTSDAIKKAADANINFKAPFESKVIKTFEKFMTKWKKGEI